MMDDYVQHALKTLKRRGYSITKPRRLVLELLDTSPEPLSAYEIRDALDAQSAHIDLVSVYRVIRCLEELNLVHRVVSSGKIRKCDLDDEETCSLHQHHHCHHLMICTQCGHIQEIHCPQTMELMAHLARQAEFTITGHQLEFFGLCKSCA